MAALKVSTKALASGSASDDSTYAALEAQITSWTTQRDQLAEQMKALLNASAFNGRAINEQQTRSLIAQGRALIAEVTAAAS